MTYSLSEYKQVAPFSGFIFKAIESANDKGAADLPVPYSGAQFVAIPEYVTFGGYVGRKVADVLKGKITVQQALDQSQIQVQKQLVASGYIE